MQLMSSMFYEESCQYGSENYLSRDLKNISQFLDHLAQSE